MTRLRVQVVVGNPVGMPTVFESRLEEAAL
jgi:hypothetical protein